MGLGPGSTAAALGKSRPLSEPHCVLLWEGGGWTICSFLSGSEVAEDGGAGVGQPKWHPSLLLTPWVPRGMLLTALS